MVHPHTSIGFVPLSDTSLPTQTRQQIKCNIIILGTELERSVPGNM